MNQYSSGTTKLTPMSLLNKVKRSLGIQTMKLPFDDEELLQILYEDSLPVFSIYFPRYYRCKIDITKLQPADKVEYGFCNRYYLNGKQFENIELIDIEDVQLVQTPMDLYFDPMFATGMDAYSIVANCYQESVMESMLQTPIICKLEPPNILLFDYMNTYLQGLMEFKFLVCHAKDLSTLQYTWREKITELFKLDLEIALYENLKRNDQIDTTFGQLELKIDDWQGAADKRAELIEKWSNEFLSYRERTIFKK